MEAAKKSPVLPMGKHNALVTAGQEKLQAGRKKHISQELREKVCQGRALRACENIP